MNKKKRIDKNVFCVDILVIRLVLAYDNYYRKYRKNFIKVGSDEWNKNFYYLSVWRFTFLVGRTPEKKASEA